MARLAPPVPASLKYVHCFNTNVLGEIVRKILKLHDFVGVSCCGEFGNVKLSYHLYEIHSYHFYEIHQIHTCKNPYFTNYY